MKLYEWLKNRLHTHQFTMVIDEIDFQSATVRGEVSGTIVRKHYECGCGLRLEKLS